MARFPNPFATSPAATGPATVSFTRQMPNSGGMTLDALMARQKELAARQADLSGGGYPGEGTIAGGLGNMLNQFTTGLAANRAREQEAQGRQELAQAVAGVNYDTGEVSPEALQTMMSRDPDTGLAFIKNAIESRRAQRQADLAASQRTEERGWTVEDREDAQAAAAELAAGKVEQWEDIETPEGAPAGQRFQRNRTTGEVKAVGGSGGVTIQNMPAEVGARIGLADVFLTDYDDIYSKVASGANTGPIDYATSAVMGRGEAGETYRKIQSGVDALRRGLTGAGMAMSEAAEYANRYLPTIRDDAASAASKLEGLKNDLMGVRSGATIGRNAPPAPEMGAPPPAPPGETSGLPEIPAGDMESYNKLPAGAQYKIPGDPLVYTKGAR